MLKLPQRTLARPNNFRSFYTLAQRNVAPNVRTSLSVMAVTALKRQQAWKLAAVFSGNKRFYAGKKKLKK